MSTYKKQNNRRWGLCAGSDISLGFLRNTRIMIYGEAQKLRQNYIDIKLYIETDI